MTQEQMTLMMIVWVVNFTISIANAWGCGRSWNETKAQGGFLHFMNWCGAIMSACGFTWCYTLLLALAGGSIPYEHEDHTSAPLLDEASVRAVVEVGYVVIIGPVIGSGIAITLETWAYAWRRRTFGSSALAGYNTFAQVHNIYEAASVLPGIFDDLGEFFGGGSGSSGGKKDDLRGIIVLVLVVIALFGGILTTAFIIRETSRSVGVDRAMRYGPYR